jgi:hypothetical protein
MTVAPFVAPPSPQKTDERIERMRREARSKAQSEAKALAEAMGAKTRQAAKTVRG